DAKTVSIRNGDGSLAVDASKLSVRAEGVCDASRQPSFTSGGNPGTVSLNGRPIDPGHEYSEPGVGVNGAPLFGKITIRFDEVTKTDAGISRREIHVIVTDRDGATVFEAAAGEVAVGRGGAVCDPPPICPPGTQPQSGRCVDVTVAPLPPPGTPPGTPPAGQQPGAQPRKTGCRDANASAKQVSERRIAAATLCLMNAELKRRHLPGLRSNSALRGAADRYARAMVAGHFFAHGDLLDRILHSGYLKRFGSWHIGENLGWGWGRGATPRAMMRAWMRSPSHRRNILGRRFRDAGVAVAFGSPGRRKPGSITYVVDFGASS
ncbi:MAG TPA: CAP domain-containing protein, partial [Thermoleophilaceae bacterium]